MNNTDKIDDINLQSFNSKDAVKVYRNEELLQKPEEVILNQIKEKIYGGKILDIGTGGGRTTRHLVEISKNYTGIDYSQAMIEECQRKFPDINFICCDVREMNVFKQNEFDFVLFSYNGIDYVSHDNRLRILKEIKRVTKKGGYFAFSAHNINSVAYTIYRSPLGPFINNPFKPFTISLSGNVRMFLNYFRGIYNHMKNMNHEVYGDEYSIINDKEQNYSVMTYYISKHKQIEQLYKAGFTGPVKTYDKLGREIADDCKNTWIYYLARL